MLELYFRRFHLNYISEGSTLIIFQKAPFHISMVFDLVPYNYQLLVVTNIWACVPHATLHMCMKKTYKYPPRFTPSTFFLAHHSWLFLPCVLTWQVISTLYEFGYADRCYSAWLHSAGAPGPDGLDVSGDPIAQGNLCSYHFPTPTRCPDWACLSTRTTNTRGRGDNVVHPLDDDNDVSQADVACPEAAHVDKVLQETEDILKQSFMLLKNS